MQRILVTGGAGYLGSILVGHLLGEGWSVTVVDNLIYGQHSLFHYCANERFSFTRGDVRDERLMRDLIPRHDVIIHLAAIVGATACDRDPLTATSVNFGATELINRVRSPQQMMLFPCTNSGYGTRSSEVYCTEETPLEPISLYAADKVRAERMLLEGGQAVSLRLATVFGMSPRMRIDLLVNSFTYHAVTDRHLVLYERHFKRNFIGVEDVARCFCFCINNYSAMRGQAFNLGLNDANLSKEELALKIKDHVPDLYIHFAEVGADPDKRNYIVSNAKINRAGFQPRQGLDDGIRQLIKGYAMFGRSVFSNV